MAHASAQNVLGFVLGIVLIYLVSFHATGCKINDTCSVHVFANSGSVVMNGLDDLLTSPKYVYMQESQSSVDIHNIYIPVELRTFVMD